MESGEKEGLKSGAAMEMQLEARLSFQLQADYLKGEGPTAQLSHVQVSIATERYGMALCRTGRVHCFLCFVANGKRDCHAKAAVVSRNPGVEHMASRVAAEKLQTSGLSALCTGAAGGGGRAGVPLPGGGPRGRGEGVHDAGGRGAAAAAAAHGALTRFP